ncbi:MAG: 50S ribosomal protein L21 [Candidatus Gracilibacteria bacterium]|jgi:large subunit ribosomal protein L21
MFAVVEIGGRQYKVTPNEKIEVEKLPNEAGESLVFDKVLLISDEKGQDAQIGKPYLKGAKVEAKVVENFKGDKIIVHKFIAKKRYSKTKGHRQNYTRLEILEIKA